MDASAPPPAVLIAGASSGIGRETALRYAERGAALALASRSAENLQPVARECAERGAAEVLVHPVDVGDRRQVEDLVQTAVARFGHLDIAVHCAAVTVFGRFDEVPADVFDAVIRTNLLGTANLARAALSHFHHRGSGQLVLVGSMLGQAAMPYQGAYVASKFAVNGLVRVLRQESREVPGIAVHGIYPGPVDTPIYANAANYYGANARPLPPVYDPTRIAAAIVRATERGRSSERNVTWVSAPLLAAYRLVPAAFDIVIRPVFRALGFGNQPVPPTSGNVFDPLYAGPAAQGSAGQDLAGRNSAGNISARGSSSR